ncbi:cation diffusion facilitator family transporter [Sedimentimonas flavescens]|uniref:cation diffusion facilitator family transporter n=1 Tax=Sedimentimonas flavescens TaxID=2851012 RepID=UPI001C4A73EC|nr:cation diffusion facilitator family transporter [Sedimentimonas flavescens]MBW0156715.1 cation diffusion facilitator family transporter [Sedimentimonas flavescens]MCT2539208.1 cation diffusion facilitator family transporter [Sedimentimonas flavescens]
MSYNDAQTRLNLSAGLASVSVAVVLVGMKLWALWATGALSIAASLADSAMDLLISGAGLGAIIYAARPADDDHAFGHSSVEDLASLGQALFVSVSAIAIAIAAGGRLLSQEPQALAAEGAGILVMALSATLTLGLVAWQARVARKTGNKVVAADMLHYVGDLLPTIGAILALWLSSRFGWAKVDSIVALIAAAIMLRGAGQIGVSAWHALMDRAAPQEIIDRIAGIARTWPGVMGFHDLKTRTAGAKIFVQLHIELDGAQSLDAAHEIAASLKRTIIEAYPQAEVIIHKDVWRG